VWAVALTIVSIGVKLIQRDAVQAFRVEILCLGRQWFEKVCQLTVLFSWCAECTNICRSAAPPISSPMGLSPSREMLEVVAFYSLGGGRISIVHIITAH
jgi:hypothetical protein